MSREPRKWDRGKQPRAGIEFRYLEACIEGPPESGFVTCPPLSSSIDPSQRCIAPIKYIYIYIYIYICNKNEADVNCVRPDKRATESRAICIGHPIKVLCEYSAMGISSAKMAAWNRQRNNIVLL